MKRLMIAASAALIGASALAEAVDVYNVKFTATTGVTATKKVSGEEYEYTKKGSVVINGLYCPETGEYYFWTGSGKTLEPLQNAYFEVDDGYWMTEIKKIDGEQTEVETKNCAVNLGFYVGTDGATGSYFVSGGMGTVKTAGEGPLVSASGSFAGQWDGMPAYGSWSWSKNATASKDESKGGGIANYLAKEGKKADVTIDDWNFAESEALRAKRAAWLAVAKDAVANAELVKTDAAEIAALINATNELAGIKVQLEADLADLNGKVDVYTNEIAALQEEIATNEFDIAVLTNVIAGLEAIYADATNNVAGLEGVTNELATVISGLNAQVDSLTNQVADLESVVSALSELNNPEVVTVISDYFVDQTNKLENNRVAYTNAIARLIKATNDWNKVADGSLSNLLVQAVMDCSVASNFTFAAYNEAVKGEQAATNEWAKWEGVKDGIASQFFVDNTNAQRVTKDAIAANLLQTNAAWTAYNHALAELVITNAYFATNKLVSITNDLTTAYKLAQTDYDFRTNQAAIAAAVLEYFTTPDGKANYDKFSSERTTYVPQIGYDDPSGYPDTIMGAQDFWTKLKEMKVLVDDTAYVATTNMQAKLTRLTTVTDLYKEIAAAYAKDPKNIDVPIARDVANAFKTNFEAKVEKLAKDRKELEDKLAELVAEYTAATNSIENLSPAQIKQKIADAKAAWVITTNTLAKATKAYVDAQIDLDNAKTDLANFDKPFGLIDQYKAAVRAIIGIDPELPKDAKKYEAYLKAVADKFAEFEATLAAIEEAKKAALELLAKLAK